MLLRPELPGGEAFPLDAYGWIPLMAGAAMTEAVRRAVDAAASAAPSEPEDDATGGVDVELKWPNDVLVSGYKVCGILSELIPGSGAVVVGAGLNLTLDEHDLPTLTSTSLLLVTGVRPDADAVLADYLGTFLGLMRTFAEHGADAAASGVADRVTALCSTVGAEVRVELPGGTELLGMAERIADDGRLVVVDETGESRSVAAGDVTHLRY